MITLLSWENINGKGVWVLTKRGFDEHTHAQTLILDVYASIPSTYPTCTRHSRPRIQNKVANLVVDEVAYMVADMEVDEVANTWWPTWR